MLNDGYSIKVYNTIQDFYKDIPSRLWNGVNATPYQFKNWQELLYTEFIKQKRPGRYIGAIMFEHDTPILGGHFFYKNTGHTKGLFLLGTGGDTDYNDLIYFTDAVHNELISKFVDSMLVTCKQTVFRISQIINTSPLNKWAQQIECDHIKSNPCAKIVLDKDYESYFRSLSKSVRQNIRTAQNRMTTDGKEYTIVSFEKGPLSDELVDKYTNIYEKRRIIKTGKQSIKDKVIDWKHNQLKQKFNLVKQAMKTVENINSAYIEIDGEIAGYYYGLLDNRGRICVIRVALNDEFGRYSPGMVLLCKVVENMINADVIREVDLTNGDEKYKFNLGAIPHSTEYYYYMRG